MEKGMWKHSIQRHTQLLHGRGNIHITNRYKVRLSITSIGGCVKPLYRGFKPPLDGQEGFPGGSSVKNLPANAGDKRDAVSFPGSGRSPGKGCGNTPPYSCLENPMDRGAWWAIVHGVAQSQTLLKWLSMQMGKNKEIWQCLVLENNYLAFFCKAEYLHVHTSERNSRYMVTGRHNSSKQH